MTQPLIPVWEASLFYSVYDRLSGWALSWCILAHSCVFGGFGGFGLFSGVSVRFWWFWWFWFVLVWFGALWCIMVRFGGFGAVWCILVHFGGFCFVLVRFDAFWCGGAVWSHSVGSDPRSLWAWGA